MSLKGTLYFTGIIDFNKNTFCVDETAKHTDVQADEVEDAVLIISSNHHPQIGDQDVLETTNDGRRQGRIELGADHLNKCKRFEL